MYWLYATTAALSATRGQGLNVQFEWGVQQLRAHRFLSSAFVETLPPRVCLAVERAPQYGFD
jgi:hypothetical protein